MMQQIFRMLYAIILSFCCFPCVYHWITHSLLLQLASVWWQQPKEEANDSKAKRVRKRKVLCWMRPFCWNGRNLIWSKILRKWNYSRDKWLTNIEIRKHHTSYQIWAYLQRLCSVSVKYHLRSRLCTACLWFVHFAPFAVCYYNKFRRHWHACMGANTFHRNDKNLMFGATIAPTMITADTTTNNKCEPGKRRTKTKNWASKVLLCE